MFVRRLLAFLIDAVPIALLVIAWFWFFQGFDVTVQQLQNAPQNSQYQLHYLQQFGDIRTLTAVLLLAYFVVFESSASQTTFGKKLMGLKVASEEGQRLTRVGALRRNLLKLVSLIPAGLLFIYALFNRERRFLHDRLTRSQTVRMR
ncbi:RDD family protein [Dongshaea marina]|uniref:RDD family protein n=1 Tax=Dongshaea marina TaxID=2047966 RepID=UPI000D3E5C38|nr:RDD family protein [Dongshaea marina]